MTQPQQRLVEVLRSEGGVCEYWPLMNDWVKDAGPMKALAFRNIVRTADALLRDGVITIDDDGMVHLKAGL